MSERWRGVSAFERLEAILANPEIHQLAAVVPTPPRHVGGRPRQYPAFMAIVYEAAISVFGSARQVEAEFAHPALWRWMRRLARKRLGVRLPRQPMRRHHYLYLRNRYLTDPGTLERLGQIHREAAARQALQLGLLDLAAGGSWTHPHLDRVLYGDGKVITPLYRAKPGDVRLDRTTGELRPLRAEPDADLHFEGTGETAWGTKFVLLAARGPDVHSRILLDVAFVQTKGGEAATAVACLERTAPLLPGAQAVVYDTALRGTHHQTILRDLGLLPINRVAAAQAGSKNARRNKREQRVEKLVFVEQKTVQLVDGTTKTIALYARGGAIGLGVLAADGELLFTALPRVRTHRNADKSGYRWYNDYRLPARLGGGTVTVRLHADAKDAARKVQPHRERPAHPARRSCVRRPVPAAQRRRVHQPGPRGHPLARPSPQPRPPTPAPQPPRLRPDGQLARRGTSPAPPAARGLTLAAVTIATDTSRRGKCRAPDPVELPAAPSGRVPRGFLPPFLQSPPS